MTLQGAEEQRLAQAYQERDYQQITRIAESMISSDYPSSMPWRYLAEAHKKLGKLAERASLIKQAAKLFPDDLEIQFELACLHLQSGEAHTAQQVFGRILRLNPEHAPTLTHQGHLLLMEGKLEQAGRKLLEAIKANPHFALAHNEMGKLLLLQEQYEHALMAFETATQLDNSLPEYRINLAKCLTMLKRFKEAKEAALRALELVPSDVTAGMLLGESLLNLQEFDEAEGLFRTLIEIEPQEHTLHLNLGICLSKKGNHVKAARAFAEAYRLNKKHLPTLLKFAISLKTLKLYQQAIVVALEAVKTLPDSVLAHRFVAGLLREQGRAKQAKVHYRKAIKLEPENTELQYLLGVTLLENQEYHKARDQLELAHALHVEQALPHLASAYVMCGETEKLLGLIPQLEARAKDYFSLSTLMFTSTQIEGHDIRYADLARRFNAVAMQNLPKSDVALPRKSPETLNIGFVSGDFKHHPVGLFLKNTIPELAKHRIKTFAYSNISKSDALTEHFEKSFHAWRNIRFMDADQACAIIKEDQIDILVDLSGHTRDGRLEIFARKPAPIQVSWLGYWDSTGLETMDYFLADPVSLPEGSASDFTETIFRLPQTRLCYSPPETSPAVSETPALKNGFITFGSFQSLRKVSHRVIQVWAEILKAVPDARFRWQCMQLDSSENRKAIAALFKQFGINPNRLILTGATNWNDYLKKHSEVDILLDSFPFPGGTTTCDAVWMGVPTVTLMGETMIARQGASLLSAAGLEDWIAQDIQDFIEKAVRAARDVEKLNNRRLEIRNKAQSLPIFNAELFAAQLSEAFFSIHALQEARTPTH
ncbi:MAG TPA: tetratricopeptide repeat protein [Pseudomonas sp.]|uniref:tetratricopeptide repeat protein n=1 Tax=Pseudomonas sp. TaxID=306 RepID=UPI002CAF9C2C|nr:tetratricopeptide repeat protein [Pseudomonas sp.]HTO19647.1 tetratricopeptide repeat protein [Pseudomonas sp.]